jgi:hypothetical protein
MVICKSVPGNMATSIRKIGKRRRSCKHRRSKTLFALAACLNSVTAHMAIQQPPPFSDSSSKSPLDPNGDNFPCQGSALQGGTVTEMAAGSVQPLQFNLGSGANTAVHGGGSCQISLGYGISVAALKDPSAWKVIHSFIGGCPTEALGNLDTAIACSSSSDVQCVNQNFTFTIPNEVQNGNAILAWTWFNNVGNREMYMNCAPVSISGGTNKMNDLPALFTANIGNGCATTEIFNTDFPNPGNYITKSNLNFPLKAPVGTCQTGSGSTNIPSFPSSNTSNFAPATASSTILSIPTILTTASVNSTTIPTASSAVAAKPSESQSSSTCRNGAVPCSSSGFFCINETTFGECAFGCAIPMQMSAGTVCSGDAIAFANYRGSRRRTVRRARNYWDGTGGS